MALSQATDMVNIGKLSAAVGLKGELRFSLYAADSENLHVGTVLHVDTDQGVRSFAVETMRYHKGKPVIKLQDIDTREAADNLAGLQAYIDEADLAELPEGEYYFRELIGLAVYDRMSASVIGVLDDIIDNPAQNIYVVKSYDGREIMIPAVDAFVKEICLDKGLIEVELIPGFL